MSQPENDELVFKALADARRRSLLDLLKEGPRTTGDLCGHFPDLDRCTVMQHLRVLDTAELIIVKREGKHRWNYLNSVPIKHIYDRWIRSYTSDAVHALDKMKKGMEQSRQSRLDRGGR